MTEQMTFLEVLGSSNGETASDHPKLEIKRSIAAMSRKIHKQLSRKSSGKPAYPLTAMEQECLREKHYYNNFKLFKRSVNKLKLYHLEAFTALFYSKVSIYVTFH